MRNWILFLLVLSLIFVNFNFTFAQENATQGKVCAVYFTGVGCPHCAKTDPVLLDKLLKKYPNLVIIEYEIYQQKENAPLLLQYAEKLGISRPGIPWVIFSKEKYIIGDSPILDNVENAISNLKENPCPLIEKSVDFNDLNLNDLPGKPKIWRDERILIKTTGGSNNELLKKLLTSSDLSSVLKGANYKVIKPESVALSGKFVLFEHAVRLNGWLFQWNGKGIEKEKKNINASQIAPKENEIGTLKPKLTLPKIASLAAVDAINPCALAVLTLMLIAILTYNPKEKRNVLFSGFAFTLAVFIMYFLYGLVIIKFFQIVQALTKIRLWLYKILGFVAIVLGILNVKDFVKYKPGGFATEMPLSLRPKVQKIISQVTSPKGAFFVGLFVTLFLLPCTIGPYIIAGGILSGFEIIKTIPPLLFYNLIFVLPMIAITLIIFAGLVKIGDVSGWKEKNIKKLHLVAGIIMFALGLGMVLGII